jgi:putative hydrolase of HD superfamily
VMANLMSGGGTWVEYNVTSDQLDSRIGTKIARGAPALWDYVRARTRVFFS